MPVLNPDTEGWERGTSISRWMVGPTCLWRWDALQNCHGWHFWSSVCSETQSSAVTSRAFIIPYRFLGLRSSGLHTRLIQFPQCQGTQLPFTITPLLRCLQLFTFLLDKYSLSTMSQHRISCFGYRTSCNCSQGVCSFIWNINVLRSNQCNVANATEEVWTQYMEQLENWPLELDQLNSNSTPVTHWLDDHGHVT